MGSNTKITASSSTNAADIIADILGDFGIWQLRTVLIVFLCKIPSAWFMACIIFTAPELEPGKELRCASAVLDKEVLISADQCYIQISNATDSKSSRCSHFEYHAAFRSLIMQFDLFCWREILVAWTQYWHLFGVLVGGVAATKLMLYFSPRRVYFAGMLALIVCGCLTGYAPNFNLHCMFRCLAAVCCALMFTAGQAIMLDVTAGQYRIGVIMLYDCFWSIGLFLLPGLSSYFYHWAHIYLGITFPTFALMVLMLWLPDSPRWLLQHDLERGIEHVESILCTAAIINDRYFKIPIDLREQLLLLRERLRSQPPPASWCQLWQGHRAKTHMIAAHLALAACIINFMGMLLNIRSFGKTYLAANTAIMGFSEIVGCFLALHISLKHNKCKWQLAGTINIIAGLLGFLGWFLSACKDMHPLVKITLWMTLASIAKASVSVAQSMLLACMGELMPANKRQTFIFSVVTCSRVWLLSAPFFNVLKNIDIALSLSAYCCWSILGGICTCLLHKPEIPMRTPEHKNVIKSVWTIERNENEMAK